MLTDYAQDLLDRRAATGARAIDLATDGEDFDTAAKDIISDILTARFGPAGKLVFHENGSGKPVLDSVAVENASALIDAALQSYFGDAEDYVEVDEPKPEPGQHGYEGESDREERIEELEKFLRKLKYYAVHAPGRPVFKIEPEIDRLLDQ